MIDQGVMQICSRTVQYSSYSRTHHTQKRVVIGRWYSVCVWSVLSVLMVTSLSQSDPNEKVDPKYGKVLGIVSETKQNPTKPASTKEPYQDSDCVRTTTETASAFEQLPGQPGSVLRRKKKPD